MIKYISALLIFCMAFGCTNRDAEKVIELENRISTLEKSNLEYQSKNAELERTNQNMLQAIYNYEAVKSNTANYDTTDILIKFANSKPIISGYSTNPANHAPGAPNPKYDVSK